MKKNYFRPKCKILKPNDFLKDYPNFTYLIANKPFFKIREQATCIVHTSKWKTVADFVNFCNKLEVTPIIYEIWRKKKILLNENEVMEDFNSGKDPITRAIYRDWEESDGYYIRFTYFGDPGTLSENVTHKVCPHPAFTEDGLCIVCEEEKDEQCNYAIDKMKDVIDLPIETIFDKKNLQENQKEYLLSILAKFLKKGVDD
jgi:hypothetical protein